MSEESAPEATGGEGNSLVYESMELLWLVLAVGIRRGEVRIPGREEDVTPMRAGDLRMSCQRSIS